jgi:UvrD-like helicase C-terminal domain/AAA domain
MAPDLPRWMVVDKTDLPFAASRIEEALRKVVDQPEPPLAQDIEELVDCLTGAAIPQRDLVAELAEREAACDLLTREQADVLDRLQLLDRVEIRGGAGSSKTWLAVEKARRLAASGQRVALMCYSRGLAEFLRRRVATLRRRERPAYVGTFHNLGIDWGVPAGSDDDSAYWEEFLPAEMVSLAGQRPESERFDAIVIDEAQDFAQSWWAAVLAALKDRESGCLYVFADEGQRVFARQGRPTVDLVPIPLTENLRNTKQIAGTFSSLAPAQMRIRGQSGVPVRFIQRHRGRRRGCGRRCRRAARRGLATGGSGTADDVPAPPRPGGAAGRGAGQVLGTYWEDDDLFYGHVLGFKGLERPAVVLAVNGFRDEARAREMLYVGLSRARDLLVVCGDMDLIRRVGGDAVARRLTGSASVQAT